MATLFSAYRKKKNQSDHAPVRPPEEVADLLLSLIGAVQSDQVRFLTPQTILLGLDNTVAFSEKEPDSSLYWAAPEKVLSGVDLGRSSLWFSLGLIIHFLCEGTSCYEAGGFTLVDLPERKLEGPSLLTQRQADPKAGFLDVLLCAQGLLTAWEPARREEGVRLLMNTIGQCPSTVDILFQAGGKTVCQQKRTVSTDGLRIPAGELLSDASGSWRVTAEQKIPFRPGSHPWTVPVESVSAKQGTPPQKDPPRKPKYVDPTDLLRDPPPKQGTQNGPVPYLHVKVGSRPLQRLMQVKPEDQSVDIPFSRKENTLFSFYFVEEDPVSGQYTNYKKVKGVKIGADAQGGDAILRLQVKADGKCTITLHTSDGASILSVYPIHFSL